MSVENCLTSLLIPAYKHIVIILVRYPTIRGEVKSLRLPASPLLVSLSPPPPPPPRLLFRSFEERKGGRWFFFHSYDVKKKSNIFLITRVFHMLRPHRSLIATFAAEFSSVIRSNLQWRRYTVLFNVLLCFFMRNLPLNALLSKSRYSTSLPPHSVLHSIDETHR